MINSFNHLFKLFFTKLFVYIINFIRHCFVECKSSCRSFDNITFFEKPFFERIFWSRNLYFCLPFDITTFSCHTNFIRIRESLSCSSCIRFYGSHIVNSQNHVLRRSYNCVSVCRVKQVSCRKHQSPTFHLRSLCKRNVNSHLVTVKVGVKRFTSKRMKF